MRLCARNESFLHSAVFLPSRLITRVRTLLAVTLLALECDVASLCHLLPSRFRRLVIRRNAAEKPSRSNHRLIKVALVLGNGEKKCDKTNQLF